VSSSAECSRDNCQCRCITITQKDVAQWVVATSLYNYNLPGIPWSLRTGTVWRCRGFRIGMQSNFDCFAISELHKIPKVVLYIIQILHFVFLSIPTLQHCHRIAQNAHRHIINKAQKEATINLFVRNWSMQQICIHNCICTDLTLWIHIRWMWISAGSVTSLVPYCHIRSAATSFYNCHCRLSFISVC